MGEAVTAIVLITRPREGETWVDLLHGLKEAAGEHGDRVDPIVITFDRDDSIGQAIQAAIEMRRMQRALLGDSDDLS